MTFFYRSGHWRTSKNGNEYWVEPHYVERYDWNRSSNNPEFHFDSGYKKTPGRDENTLLSLSALLTDELKSNKVTTSITSFYVIPNAECPVCGDYVFFYQNEHGSKVDFDELGPPWPRHPCTDNQKHQSKNIQQNSQVLSPIFRTSDEISFIQEKSGITDHDLQNIFFQKYRSKPLDCWKLVNIRKESFRPNFIISF